MESVQIQDALVKRPLKSKPKNLPTASVVRELLHYDRHTGIFTWAVDRTGGTKAGMRAGYLAGGGHIQISILGKPHYAQRVAWLLTYGAWPPDDLDVDHEDGDKTNNAIKNLRLATPSENAANAHKLRRNNTSGFRGVSFYKLTGRWTAKINVNRRLRHLGYFDSAEAAARAYDRAAITHFGQFASCNFPPKTEPSRSFLALVRHALLASLAPVRSDGRVAA